VKSRYRWFVASIFFLFLILHQADKLLIGPLTTSIIAICVSTWLTSAALMVAVGYFGPHDVEALRQTMRKRAAENRARGSQGNR
jgi:hypothetical protein